MQAGGVTEAEAHEAARLGTLMDSPYQYVGYPHAKT
jgi:hypothetical protein